MSLVLNTYQIPLNCLLKISYLCKDLVKDRFGWQGFRLSGQGFSMELWNMVFRQLMIDTAIGMGVLVSK